MTNPYPAYSHLADEYIYWDKGRTRGGGELGFLRELHQSGTLQALKAAVKSVSPYSMVKVSSIWLDKYPMVRPHARTGISGLLTQQREIADLAVIIRMRMNRLLRVRMWLLQGKVDTFRWQRQANSRKEIDLYESLPRFDLYSSQFKGARNLGTFDIASDFPKPSHVPIPMWSYLLFADPKQVATPVKPSHVAHQWPSDASRMFTTTFTNGLVGMLNAMGTKLGFGADASPRTSNHEWRKLYLALMENALAKTSHKLPDGAWVTHGTMSSRRGAGQTLTLSDSTFSFMSTGLDQSELRLDPTKSQLKKSHKGLRREFNRVLASSSAPPRGPLDGAPPDFGKREGDGISYLIVDVIDPQWDQR